MNRAFVELHCTDLYGGQGVPVAVALEAGQLARRASCPASTESPSCSRSVYGRLYRQYGLSGDRSSAWPRLVEVLREIGVVPGV